MRIFLILLTIGLMSWVVGCATREQGSFSCDRLANAQDRADCRMSNKRLFDEYDKAQRKESISLKGAIKEDETLCYKNPRAGEKACAIN